MTTTQAETVTSKQEDSQNTPTEEKPFPEKFNYIYIDSCLGKDIKGFKLVHHDEVPKEGHDKKYFYLPLNHTHTQEEQQKMKEDAKQLIEAMKDLDIAEEVNIVKNPETNVETDHQAQSPYQLFTKKPVYKPDKNGRPTFKLGDKPVRACGTLITYQRNGLTWYLLRNEVKKGLKQLCDIGGKTDKCDETIFDTLFRELEEETIGKLFSVNPVEGESRKIYQKLLERRDMARYYYLKNCKYLLVHINLSDESLPRELQGFWDLPLSRFGNIEHTTGQQHEYKWMLQVPLKRLNPRLQTFFKIRKKK